MTRALLPEDRTLLITNAGRDALEAELRQLRAALHENAPHGGLLPDPLDPAMTIQGRIIEVEAALSRAVVSHPGPSGFELAAVGTTVKVDDGRRFCHYAITLGAPQGVPEDAVAVSASSPVGRALMGRAVGEIVPVTLPDGRTRHLRLLQITEAS